MSDCHKYISRNSQIAKIIGTEGNDIISFICGVSTSMCSLSINSDSCIFETRDLKPYGLEIDLKGGNDQLNVNISDVGLMAMLVKAEQGANSLSISLNAPYSAAEIRLGVERNELHIDTNKPSNSIVMGIRDNENNEIHIKNAKNKNYEVIPDNKITNVFDVLVDGKVMVKLYSGYTPEEMDILALSLYAAEQNTTLPKDFVDMGLSFDHPPSIDEISIENNLFFD